MKTHLIDPFSRTITAHDYDGELKTAYALLHCRQIEAVAIDGTDALYVDEEGIMCNLAEQAFFKLDDRPLAGYAMTVGTDDDGDDVEATIGLDELKARISWTTLPDLISDGSK